MYSYTPLQKTKKYEAFVKKHRRIMLAASSLFIIASVVLMATTALMPVQKNDIGVQPTPKQQPTGEPPKYYSPLTGKQVSKDQTTRQVSGMMLGNSAVSRPQSGLKEAGVVFEAVAEAGITRMLALYQETTPNLIGSVRSLRPYYLSWGAPFDAAIGHVGGSAKALKQIRGGGYKDIDQFFAGNYYYRASDRPAPHNVYITGAKLNALNKARGYTKSKFTGFPRKLGDKTVKANATKINVGISTGDYSVSFTYDKKSNTYPRTLGGTPHVDREKGRIAPNSIVVIKVPVHVGFEDGYREQMTTTGHNKAYVFQDGTVTEGFWQKIGQKDQIVFYDKFGRVIPLNVGQTWVSVIAPNKSVTWR